jgi:hypothetical protein
MIEPLGGFLSVGKTRELLRLLCFSPQQCSTQVVQCLAFFRSDMMLRRVKAQEATTSEASAKQTQLRAGAWRTTSWLLSRI